MASGIQEPSVYSSSRLSAPEVFTGPIERITDEITYFVAAIRNDIAIYCPLSSDITTFVPELDFRHFMNQRCRIVNIMRIPIADTACRYLILYMFPNGVIRSHLSGIRMIEPEPSSSYDDIEPSDVESFINSSLDANDSQCAESEADISMIPLSNNEVETDVCTICQESNTGQIRTSDCGHIFHDECIRTLARYSSTCPNCRAPLC